MVVILQTSGKRLLSRSSRKKSLRCLSTLMTAESSGCQPPYSSGSVFSEADSAEHRKALERDSVTESIEHHFFEHLSHRDSRIALSKHRSLADVACELPCARYKLVARQYLIHDA